MLCHEGDLDLANTLSLPQDLESIPHGQTDTAPIIEIHRVLRAVAHRQLHRVLGEADLSQEEQSRQEPATGNRRESKSPELVHSDPVGWQS